MLRPSAQSLALLVSLGSAVFSSAFPASIDYQGYLTARDGAALNNEVLISFSIYAVDVGGSPLWSETLLVDVENSLFTVRLGRPANPFPLNLFETPLYLGIAVESDLEMIPRRELTAVAFAFHAEDADQLQGRSAADLDQSAHVMDLANPHALTASQTGAADEAIVDAHIASTSNPHLVTAAGIGAADSSLVLTHVSDDSAHHARYTDSDAFSAISAMDGPGSGLDSDTIDGLEGAALQAAITANTEQISMTAAQVAANTTEIGELSAQIAGKSTGVRVFSEGVELGTLVDGSIDWTRGGNGNITIVTTGSHLVVGFLDNGTWVMNDFEAVSFDQPDCQGNAFIQASQRGLGATIGFVFNSCNSSNIGTTCPRFYVPKGAQIESGVVTSSYISENGCSNGTSSASDRYPAFSNNAAVTGLPDSDEGVFTGIDLRR